MKITTKGRYGLRTMMELAINFGNGPVSRSSIAKCHDLSAKYMHNLLTSLMSAGLVKSIRGNVGGYVLAKDPKDIDLLQIIEALEGPLRLVECTTNEKSCDRQQTCATYEIWTEANEVIRKHFSGKTLEDLAKISISKNKPKLDSQVPQPQL